MCYKKRLLKENIPVITYILGTLFILENNIYCANVYIYAIIACQKSILVLNREMFAYKSNIALN